MKKSLLIAMTAGFAFTGAAMAQEAGPLPFGGEVRVSPINVPSGGGYEGRAVATTYDCLSNGFGNGSATHLGTSSMILEDINFTPGPWSGSVGRVISEITFGVAVINTPVGTEDFVLVFWDEDDVNKQGWAGAGTNMINPAAVPIQVLVYALDGTASGFYWQFTSGGLAVPVPDDDSGVVVQAVWVNDAFVPAHWSDVSGGIYEGCASTTSRSNVFCSQSGAPVGGNAASPGTTDIAYGRDISNAAMCPNIGQMIGNGGAPVGAGNVEHRTIAASPQRGYMFRARGDVPPPPPPACTALGAIADAGLTVNGVATSGAINWYCLSLNGGAQDAALQFLDVDSEGSATDVAIALFGDDGNPAGFVGSDDDDGSGTNAQLSYGVGRRAAVGDGVQYDGRDGELAAGNYYLAVGPAGSTFGAGFTATGSANPGGNFSVNFATNTNGSALAPSVAPLTAHDYGGTPIVYPDLRAGLNAGVGLRGVIWTTFTNSAEAGSGDSFFDIDFTLTSTPSADGVAYIFDANGEQVVFSDDEGTNALPMFSFGAGTGPRTYNGNLEQFTGQNGNLPAGQYYMALALFATQDIVGLGGNDRWHVRGTSGSNLTVTGDIYTGGTPGGGIPCELSDTNCDGSLNGFDVEATEQAVNGDFSNFCLQSADLNNDGAENGFDVEFSEFLTLNC